MVFSLHWPHRHPGNTCRSNGRARLTDSVMIRVVRAVRTRLRQVSLEKEVMRGVGTHLHVRKWDKI